MKRAVLLFAAGCITGGGVNTHNDFVAQMQAAQPALAACYAKTLATSRAQGMVTLSFAAAPGTGQFTDIVVVQDQVRDPALLQCVVTTVGALHLAVPQDSRVAVSYPIHFAPAP